MGTIAPSDTIFASTVARRLVLQRSCPTQARLLRDASRCLRFALNAEPRIKRAAISVCAVVNGSTHHPKSPAQLLWIAPRCRQPHWSEVRIRTFKSALSVTRRHPSVCGFANDVENPWKPFRVLPRLPPYRVAVRETRPEGWGPIQPPRQWIPVHRCGQLAGERSFA